MATIEAIKTLFSTLKLMNVKDGPSFRNAAQKELNERVWMDCMDDVSDEELAIATKEWLNKPSKYRAWPAPGDLRELVPREQMETLDDSDEAWGLLMDLVTQYGSMNQPKEFHKNSVKSALMKVGLKSAGGWRTVCATTYDNHAPMRASFRAAYRSAKKRHALNAKYDQKLLELTESIGRIEDKQT